MMDKEQLLQSVERLFFDDFDVRKELDNTKMFIMLKKITGNMQAGGVAKYANYPVIARRNTSLYHQWLYEL